MGYSRKTNRETYFFFETHVVGRVLKYVTCLRLKKRAIKIYCDFIFHVSVVIRSSFAKGTSDHAPFKTKILYFGKGRKLF